MGGLGPGGLDSDWIPENESCMILLCFLFFRWWISDGYVMVCLKTGEWTPPQISLDMMKVSDGLIAFDNSQIVTVK